MFVVLLARMLASHAKGGVVLACGTTLMLSGIGVFIAGVTLGQPLIAGAGLIIVLGAIVFAAFAIRAWLSARRMRHSHSHDEPAST